jgi:hypothetical protein
MKDLFSTFKRKAKGGIMRTEGIGIGLSTAQALCSSMGGNIFVSSSLGYGTNVTFSLQMRNRQQDINSKALKIQTIALRNILQMNQLQDGVSEDDSFLNRDDSFELDEGDFERGENSDIAKKR